MAQLAVVFLFTGITWRNAAASAITVPVVERVQVMVESVSPIPKPLRTRIEMSVAGVAERVIRGKPVDTVQEQKDECERIIAEIFRRLLTGFSLDRLDLAAAPEARIVMRLTPEAPLVSRVELALAAPDLPRESLDLIEREMRARQDRYSDIFLGVPVEALAWARPTLAGAFEEELDEHFPGFKKEVSFGAGETLEVAVRMTPLQPRVEQVRVEISSRTLPQLLIGRWRERVAAHFAAFEGLPLAYLRRYQVYFECRGAERLAQDRALERFGLLWQVKLSPGPVTRISLQAEAKHYSLAGLASLEIADPPVFGLSLQTGVRPLPDWELRGEFALGTGDEKFDLLLTLAYLRSEEMSLGFTYGIRREERILWLRYASGRGDLFVLSGDLEANSLTATIGMTMEPQFTVALMADSSRNYSLILQVGL